MPRRPASFARSLVVLLVAPLVACGSTTPPPAHADLDASSDPSADADADAAPGLPRTPT